MARYTRAQMAEDLVERLQLLGEGRALQLCTLLIPEVKEILDRRRNDMQAQRLEIEQEAWGLQSEPNPPYTKR
jgi:hypothetical protein